MLDAERITVRQGELVRAHPGRCSWPGPGGRCATPASSCPSPSAPDDYGSSATFDPLYYLVVASRHLASGQLGAPATWQAFAGLVPLTALTLWWSTSVFGQAVS